MNETKDSFFPCGASRKLLWYHRMASTADGAEFKGHKCICNAFIMFKYAIQFANTANSLPNLDFDNRYVGTTNFQGIFGICMTHKSLLSTRALDLHTWHMLSLYFKFLLCANLITNFKFPIEFAAIAFIFEHYNCIANAFARCSNSVLSAMKWHVQVTCDPLSRINMHP